VSPICFAQSMEAAVARGICRTKTGETGAEYARVDFGTSGLSTVPRSLYDRHGYKPPYDELPLCNELDA
jgi:hypothetical protein